jgi:cardiolipin synthase C
MAPAERAQSAMAQLKHVLSSLLSVFLSLLAGSLLLPGCGRLPDLANRPPSSAFHDTSSTRLGLVVSRRFEIPFGQSGVLALPNGLDAFAARASLIEAAERSIDVQYYIWHEDLSGTLLFEALQRAADRGVRVRMLLDDNRTFGMDEQLAALDAHPNIEVRLFNPFKFRYWRVFEYVADFRRVNRRMHNKSFTVDNQVTVIGGRNIGDEYFAAADEGVMYDLDALAIGDVVRHVSDDFDRYWASNSSYPASRMLPKLDARAIAALRAAAVRLESGPNAVAYREAIAQRPQVQSLVEGQLQFNWAITRLVSDDPAKALGGETSRSLWNEIRTLLRPQDELGLVSPYVVPHREGADFLLDAAARRVRVSVLTNSLEATDVAAVHAGYAKWRKKLLRGGVRLFELKRDLSAPRIDDTGPFASSASSLHAKTFTVDRSRIFIGSFNFDPRSARLNTENGFIIDSPAMAQTLSDAFSLQIPERSYEVTLSAQGDLQWIERRGGAEVVHTEEPGVSRWRTYIVSVISILPIDWML